MNSRIILSILRPQFWIISLIPAIFGSFLAGAVLPSRGVLLICLILVGVSGLAELVNNYVDQDSDRFQLPKKVGYILLSGGSPTTTMVGVSLRQLLSISAILLMVIFGSSIFLPPRVLILTLISCAMAIGFSTWPFKLKERGILGTIDIVLGRGFMSFSIGWAVFQPLTLEPFLIGLFLSLLNFGSATLPHLADYSEDKDWGIRTFPVVSGFKFAARTAAIGIVASFALLSLIAFEGLIDVSSAALPLAMAGLILAYLIVQLRPSDPVITKLQLLSVILFLTGPLVFI